MKLRVGIVNVGPAWETRHLPALRALSDRFEVRAVCDAVQQRAQFAAQQLGASVCDGFQIVARRTDVDALLLLSAGWYGALPIFSACDAGKAVYCAADLDLEDNQAQQLRSRVEQAGIAFMAEFPCRMSPATLRLKELIATRLGQPRLVFCNRRHLTTAKDENPKSADEGHATRDLVELVDWCRYVIGMEPSSLVATNHQSTNHHSDGPTNLDYFSVTLDFSPSGESSTGPMAQIGCGDYIPEAWRESVAFRRPAELEVVCDGGVAFVDLPNTVAWFDEAGQHLETLEHERPVGEQLLLYFHRAVESLVLKTSSLDDAYRALSIAGKVRQSCESGSRVACGEVAV